MKITFKTTFIVLSFFSILVILIDYFFTNKVIIEGGIIHLITLLFSFNILRLTYSKLSSNWIGIVMNIGIVGLLFFNFFYLGIIYLGGSSSIIFNLIVLLNVVFFLTIMFWFGKQLQKKIDY